MILFSYILFYKEICSNRILYISIQLNLNLNILKPRSSLFIKHLKYIIITNNQYFSLMKILFKLYNCNNVENTCELEFFCFASVTVHHTLRGFLSKLFSEHGKSILKLNVHQRNNYEFLSCLFYASVLVQFKYMYALRCFFFKSTKEKERETHNIVKHI